MSLPSGPAALIEVPVFPLPDTVLFPGTLLPLHVFEPRYRRLLSACLEGDRRMGISLLKPGWESDYYGVPDIFEVFGVGEVVDHQAYADGTSDVILRGVSRARLVEYRRDEPFRVAVAEELSERSAAAATDDAVAFLKYAFSSPIPRGLSLIVANFLSASVAGSVGQAVDLACATLVWEPLSRQSLLETLDPDERLWKLGALLSQRGSGGSREGGVDPFFPDAAGEDLN